MQSVGGAAAEDILDVADESQMRYRAGIEPEAEARS